MAKKYIFSFLLFLITSLGIFLRVYQLSFIPASITYDELDHVVNGLSILYTGRDFQGQHFFWELYPTQTHTYTAELSALWHTVISLLFSSNVAYARLPNLIAGLLFSLGIAAFSYQVLRSKFTAIVVFALIIVSPWHILLSRTAYEAPIALSWLMVSMVTFWQVLNTKSIKMKVLLGFLSVMTMLASFYTYHGYKPIYPFIYTVLFIWNRKPDLSDIVKKRALLSRGYIPLIIIVAAWLVAFSLFGFRLTQGEYGGRSNEISLLNAERLSQEVNKRRQISLENSFDSFFTNKITVINENIMSNLLESFNLPTLFVSGFDHSYMIGLWEHGFLYLIQLPLIIIGLIWGIMKKKRDICFLIILLSISLFPTSIHTGSSISLRSGLFIPILIIFSALGISYILKERYRYKQLVSGLLIFLFFVSIANFAYFYFYRFPINTIDTSIFQERLLSSYISRNANAKDPIVVFTGEPFNSIRIHAFYSRLITKDSINKWQAILKDPSKQTYTYANITFTRDCALAPQSKSSLIITNPKLADVCGLEKVYAESKNKQLLVLASPRDNRDYYRVYNDKLCNNSLVPDYIRISKADSFEVEKLHITELCGTWLRKENTKVKIQE